MLLLGHFLRRHGRLQLLQSLLALRPDLLPLDLGLLKVVPLPMIVNAVALSHPFGLHKELSRLTLAVLLVMRQHLLGAGRSRDCIRRPFNVGGAAGRDRPLVHQVRVASRPTPMLHGVQRLLTVLIPKSFLLPETH